MSINYHTVNIIEGETIATGSFVLIGRFDWIKIHLDSMIRSVVFYY